MSQEQLFGDPTCETTLLDYAAFDAARERLIAAHDDMYRRRKIANETLQAELYLDAPVNIDAVLLQSAVEVALAGASAAIGARLATALARGPQDKAVEGLVKALTGMTSRSLSAQLKEEDAQTSPVDVFINAQNKELVNWASEDKRKLLTECLAVFEAGASRAADIIEGKALEAEIALDDVEQLQRRASLTAWLSLLSRAELGTSHQGEATDLTDVLHGGRRWWEMGSPTPVGLGVLQLWVDVAGGDVKVSQARLPGLPEAHREELHGIPLSELPIAVQVDGRTDDGRFFMGWDELGCIWTDPGSNSKEALATVSGGAEEVKDQLVRNDLESSGIALDA